MRVLRVSVGAIALGLTVGCSAPTVNYSMEAPMLSSLAVNEHADAEQPEQPELAAREAVSLHAILAYEDKNSPLLGVARANLGLGKAAMLGASPRLPADPSVSIALGPRIGANGTGLDFSLGVTQQIEISGARGLRIESAKRLSDLKKMELKQSQWLVHQQVHRLFHQALIAKEQTVASEERLKFAESLVFIARRRLEAGDIALLGVRVAEGE
ncbi:MAG: TolC family protein, partial [Kofleriaceae bacterium]|nr:TolC family protein [Kofleriaceae bacterium]